MADADARTIVYVHNAGKVGGGNKVLLGLFDRLDRRRFRPASILPMHGPMEAELASRSVPVHVVPMDRALASASRIDALRCTAAFARVLLKERPALVHANGVLSYRYASLPAFLCGIRRICHVHHPGEVEGAEWTLRVRPDVVITVSGVMLKEVTERLSRMKRPPRVVQITNTVDTVMFVPCGEPAVVRHEAGLDRFSSLVTIIGSVNEHKGHTLFLEMARRLLTVEPHAGFLVIGDDVRNNGAYRRKMEELAAQIGIASSVIFYGFASDELTRRLLAASDVFVLPTREEGFGLALAEAQACGIPVVSTRVGPIPEVVADGDTGVLVPVDDVSALTGAVSSLLKDPERRRAMGLRGRERAVRLFGPERYAREMEKVYEQVLQVRG